MFTSKLNIALSLILIKWNIIYIFPWYTGKEGLYSHSSGLAWQPPPLCPRQAVSRPAQLTPTRDRPCCAICVLDKKSRLLSKPMVSQGPLPSRPYLHAVLLFIKSMNAFYSLTGMYLFLYKSCYSEADVSEMLAQYLSLGPRCCMMRSSGIRFVSER